MVDSGGQYLEGTTDITRTLAVGEVSEEFIHNSTRVLQGMIRLSMVKFAKGTRGNQLDAIARFGKENARGIAVVDHTVTNRELEILHEGGVRGLRFSVWNPNNAVITMEDCLPLSQRIKEFGWNIQLHMSAAQIASYADLISSLECKVVIDHMGRLDPKLGTGAHP